VGVFLFFALNINVKVYDLVAENAGCVFVSHDKDN
jgi:hypothetical protein